MAAASVGEHREHPRVTIQVVVRDFAPGKKADQRHIAQRVAHDVQLGTGAAKVRAAPA